MEGILSQAQPLTGNTSISNTDATTPPGAALGQQLLMPDFSTRVPTQKVQTWLIQANQGAIQKQSLEGAFLSSQKPWGTQTLGPGTTCWVERNTQGLTPQPNSSATRPMSSPQPLPHFSARSISEQDYQ